MCTKCHSLFQVDFFGPNLQESDEITIENIAASQRAGSGCFFKDGIRKTGKSFKYQKASLKNFNVKLWHKK